MTTFLQDVRGELQKTSWPSRKEVRNTTIVVIVFVMICAVYLYAVDYALQTAMEWLVRRFAV
jgi:preprotein translocase subunit SecE